VVFETGRAKQAMKLTMAHIRSAQHVPVAIILAVSLPLPLRADQVIAPYCADLQRVAELATTRDRFASISAKPREGNFIDTSLGLSGWNDCSIYGTRSYTCDSQAVEGAEQASQAQQRILHEVQACLAESWGEVKDRSSVGYSVLQHLRQPVSITLSTDPIEQGRYVVRLILFARSK
jgi:hypothetical protein